MTHIDHPIHIDAAGRTAAASDDEYVRDLIEQVLFTAPGERVNRPAFGCGVRQLVFSPNSAAVATTTEFLIQGALQEWLGELIAVERVQVEAVENTLRIVIQFINRRTQTSATVELPVPGDGV